MAWKLKEKLQERLKRETGTIVKDPGGKLRVALVYPNTYRVGMGNLAVHAIYDILNQRRDVVCERVFLPDPDEIREYGSGSADLMSLESQTQLSKFDAIAFTISFENDYLNILPILSLAKIPHRKSMRDGSHPVLIAGGAAPTLNPKPISEIFDRIVLGEFEAYVDQLPAMFCRDEKDLKQDAGSRMQDDKAETDFPASSFQLPASKRKYIEDLNIWPTQTTIYNDEVEFGGMHLIEAQRGCPRSCRFCATPNLYRPFRFRSAARILEMADRGFKHRRKIGLIGADILSHPEFVEMATGIHARGMTFSPSSVRVDAIDDLRAHLLAESKHRSIALGIEAGDEGLRDALGKKTSDEQILESAAILARHGITRLRLYFMIGLPGETQADIRSIADLSKKILKRIQENAPKGEGSHRLDVTISPFIPKPGTPFEDEIFSGEKYLKGAIEGLKGIFKEEKGISLNFDSAIAAATEAILANGGSDVIQLLEDVFSGVKIRAALKTVISGQ